MAYASITYTSASGTTFALTNSSGDPIPYLRQADIAVTVNGTLKAQGTDYTFNSAGTSIVFNVAVSNATVVISRTTDISDATVVYTAGSTLTAQDLNNADNQIRYGLQEFSDTYNAITTGTGDLSTLGGFIGSAEVWVADNAHAATTGAIDGRIDSKIDTALTTDVVAGDSITVTDNSPGSGQITIGVTNASISTAKLVDASVTTAKIADANVTTAKIADSNVTTAKIADSAVTSAKIADGTIVASDLASDAVTTAKILDANVTTGKIADGAVTTGKLADSSVTSGKIADGTIVAGDLASDSVTTAKILDANVTTAKIADSAVTTGKIADSAVTAVKIADGVITSAKLNASTVVTAAEQSASTPDDTSFFTTSASDARYVNVTGDTMSGALAMGNNKITGLATPTVSTDASTKGYVDATVAAASIPDTDYGDITVTGTGTIWTIDSGAVTSAKIADGTLVNADINASAAIAGTKISPDFGSQNTTTTGTSTAASFIPTSSTVPTNGVYLPSANNVAISTNSAQRLLIDASGLVGVGVTPTEKFQVGATNNSTVAIKISNSGTYGFLQQNATSGTGAIELGSGGAFPLVLSTNQTERMRLDSSGRLGVGTSTPGYRLDVTSQLGCTHSGAIRHLVNIDSDGGKSYWYNGTPTNTAYILGDTGNAYFAGKLGIGTTSPTCELEIGGNGHIHLADQGRIGCRSATSSGAPEDAYVKFYDSDIIGFHTTDTERARIDSSGRLLIGTSTAQGSANIQIQGDGDSAKLYLRRNITNSAMTSSGQVVLGSIDFGNIDGAVGARIQANNDTDSGWANNDYPSRLVISTTADGASSPTERMRILADGNTRFVNCTDVYPNTDNAVRLGASGVRWSAVWAANGTIQTSDERAKTDISDAQLGSDFIKSLRPVSYKWIEGGKVDSGKRDDKGNYIYESAPGTRTHWGFIAQEVKQAVDAAGVDFGGWILTDKDDPDSQQALRYDQFIAPLTKALQEALAEIDILKAKVAALEAS
jgi:hypothetical protein